MDEAAVARAILKWAYAAAAPQLRSSEPNLSVSEGQSACSSQTCGPRHEDVLALRQSCACTDAALNQLRSRLEQLERNALQDRGAFHDYVQSAKLGSHSLALEHLSADWSTQLQEIWKAIDSQSQARTVRLDALDVRLSNIESVVQDAVERHAADLHELIRGQQEEELREREARLRRMEDELHRQRQELNRVQDEFARIAAEVSKSWPSSPDSPLVPAPLQMLRPESEAQVLQSVPAPSSAAPLQVVDVEPAAWRESSSPGRAQSGPHGGEWRVALQARARTRRGHSPRLPRPLSPFRLRQT